MACMVQLAGKSNITPCQHPSAWLWGLRVLWGLNFSLNWVRQPSPVGPALFTQAPAAPKVLSQLRAHCAPTGLTFLWAHHKGSPSGSLLGYLCHCHLLVLGKMALFRQTGADLRSLLFLLRWLQWRSAWCEMSDSKCAACMPDVLGAAYNISLLKGYRLSTKLRFLLQMQETTTQVEVLVDKREEVGKRQENLRASFLRSNSKGRYLGPCKLHVVLYPTHQTDCASVAFTV